MCLAYFAQHSVCEIHLCRCSLSWFVHCVNIAAIYLSIPLLMAMWIVSILGLLQTVLLGTFLSVTFDAHVLSFLLGITVGEELPGHTACIQSASVNRVKQLSKGLYLVSFPPHCSWAVIALYHQYSVPSCIQVFPLFVLFLPFWWVWYSFGYCCCCSGVQQYNSISVYTIAWSPPKNSLQRPQCQGQ